ncbi:MAG: NADH-quinone oxidoreductase subunit L [Planctomycetes bacterium]|nr:NADH-quinone oxidoreductase subunit L [Planctomycetota bacterium]
MPNWLPLFVWLVPLSAALVTGRLPWRSAGAAHGIATGMLAATTALAVWMTSIVLRSGGTFAGPHFDWLDLGSFSLGVGVMVDPMAAIMAVIVGLLATLVMAFNAWYMHDEPKAARFPWQFCFFVFAMLGVVLSDNLFLSFCCWELVGLGSYLLIGFWFDRPAASADPEYQATKNPDPRGVLEHLLSPAHAQLKAFVMNRVGDAGFLIGIGALLSLMVTAGEHGSVLDFVRLPGAAAAAQSTTFLGLSGGQLLTLAALGIFCGAVGKSAQFPLHTWLPDAMQGPTTASSIIHAATMVAAGVFLVARCYAMFPADALAVVGWTGGITCLFAATIACVQWDLKAVLAYSTVSQLGLMFVGLGAGDEHGGRAAGIAHLFTHATFKCLLFLCAGAVIHAANGLQDLHRMGGLRRTMPVTAWCSLIAVLAIAGAPAFSGFYSKDAVIAAALAHATAAGGAAWGPFLLAAAGSLLTSFYMLRWWIRVFAGEPRDDSLVEHAHDPAGAAKWVLIALAPFALSLPWTTGDWLDRALRAPHAEHLHAAHGQAVVLASALLLAGAAAALFLYWWAVRRDRDTAGALASRLRPLHRGAQELWGIDRLQDLVFTRGLGRWFAGRCARVDLGSPSRLRALDEAGDRRAADPLSLDGAIDGLGRFFGGLARRGAVLHGGRTGAYLAFVAIVVGAGLWWSVLR